MKDRGNLDKNNTQSVGEKAYNLLAKQENISINKAKNLIDSGMVSAKGVRIKIGRIILPNNTKFEVMQPLLNTIFENEDLLILDKGVGIESYSLEQQYSPYKLINRLDRDTSGIILLAKNKEVRKRAISEFKQRKVHKIYLALVSGKIHDEIKINKRINTDKNTHATSYIATTGKDALSIVQPLRILNGNTFVQIDIPTGRTHQIRIHLASIKHPIIGDILYGNDSIASKRLMLHCHKTSLLGYEFVSKLNVEKEFGIE
ncbi:RluA family pseudouridine synthase [Helicobacter didelphidarum]|nr:RluA family pseudouridine synthase [Helicobacter didelphidarum]